MPTLAKPLSREERQELDALMLEIESRGISASDDGKIKAIKILKEVINRRTHEDDSADT